MERKRFYRMATVVPVDQGFRVDLDGRAVRTPAGRPLLLPTLALARAIAKEWLAQSDKIRPQTMPITALAATAIDRVAPRRAAVIDAVLDYGGSDLLCYRADEPAALVARQQACWQPALDWVAERWGANLRVTSGIMPVQQPPEALAALRRAVEACDPLDLTALSAAVPLCGSLVLGLALVHGRLDAEQVCAAAHLDQAFQIERWGEDDALTAALGRLRAELMDAATFIALAHDTAATAHAG